MKACTTWNYTPYRPFMFEGGDVYICRMAPSPTAVTLDWLPADSDTYTVCWRVEGQDDFQSLTTAATTATIDGLTVDTDYEIYVETADGRRSRTRLARTGEVVGTVVNYLHPRDDYYAFSGKCLCSPCIVRHPQGHLLASMDVFGHGTPQNLSLIFRSDDDGATWRYVTELYPCFWGRMFVHKDELYMLACSTEYGDLLIGKSTDGGNTFCKPTVLLRGACHTAHPGPHKNPQPVVEYNGRLWNTMEWGSWAGFGTHASMMMSAPADADLLDAANWSFTQPVKYDPAWPGTAVGKSGGTIEGCPVVAPDGKLYNIMRYQMMGCEPNYGRALVFSVDTDNPEAPLTFDRAMEFPGNHSKFVIRQDPITGYYYSIVCRIRDASCAGHRNLCSLLRSRDLVTWELVTDLIDGTDKDPKFVGFQYVDWIIEGEDILFLSRTAINEAKGFHDNNYSTFHRVQNFRKI